MTSQLTDDTNAILLLCAVLGKAETAKPLTQSEYTRLTQWLLTQGMRPADLLGSVDTADVATGAGLDPGRLAGLLGRGTQLGFAVEEWQRAGVWIVSRSDREYPNRYKRHLREKSPPLLFGVGDKALLRGGGLAVVGSRNVDKDGEAFTRDVGERCARDGIPVVSGAARGVDQTAMSSALKAGGVVIGVVAENLLKKAVGREARYAIADDRLLLISPYHPGARFTVGNAMGRNKLIYALADFGLVVSSAHGKGGTWAGATEELKRDRARPVFVRLDETVPLGNKKLLELGAFQWPAQMGSSNLYEQLRECANKKKSQRQTQGSLPLFGIAEKEERYSSEELVQKDLSAARMDVENDQNADPVYEAVLPLILGALSEPMKADDLAHQLNVVKKQLHEWLKKGVEARKISKMTKPVRYCRKENA